MAKIKGIDVECCCYIFFFFYNYRKTNGNKYKGWFIAKYMDYDVYSPFRMLVTNTS